MTRPDWFPEALEQMKSSGRHGLVMVFDEPNLMDQIGAMYGEPDRKARLECVVAMRVSPGTADGWFREAGEAVNLILLDPEGNRVTAANLDIRKQLQEGTFAESCSGLIPESSPPGEDAVVEMPFGIRLKKPEFEDSCLGCGMAHDIGIDL